MAGLILSDAELRDITGYVQGAAQIKLLKRLGIKVERKANGKPLVWRCDVERRNEAPAAREVAPPGRATVPASNEPNWGRR